MIINTKLGKYKWINDWVKIPKTVSGQENGRTHGITVSKTGNIIVCHQAVPSILTYSADGKLLDAKGDFIGVHGMTLVEENGTEYLWITDVNNANVSKITLDSDVVMSLEPPAHPAYKEGKYVPTWVAVNEERFGGNGDIWVTDGYGCHIVHRFDKRGKYLSSIDGTEGKAGRLSCPHGIWLDTRKSAKELYIADRSNKRIQVYDLDGNYLRVFANDFLTSPDCFFIHKDLLVIPELFGRITLVDIEDKLIDYLGENDKIEEKEGWPNNRSLIEEGKFNSPHGAAVDANGNIYVSEWITGGRIIKLEKLGV